MTRAVRATPGSAAVSRARAGVAVAFATHAAIAGTLGPWVPTIKTDTGLDAGGLGLALSGYAIGLVVGTRLSDTAMRLGGGRGVVRVALPVQALAFATLPLANGFATLAAIFAVVGVASGLVDVAMNGEAVAVEERAGRPIMSSLHGVWSVSVLAGSGAASLAIAGGVSLAVYVPTAVAVLALASSPALRWLPERGHHPDDPSATRRAPASLRRIALLCAAAGGSFLSEGVAIEWSAVLLREGLGAAAATAGLGVVAFSAGMATSRFSGDRLGARFGRERLAMIGAACGSTALGAALLVGDVVGIIVALGVLGLGLGTVVPAAFGAAGRIARSRGRSALAIAVTAGYVGAIVGPLLVGATADAFGLRVAFAIPVAAAAISAVGLGTGGGEA